MAILQLDRSVSQPGVSLTAMPAQRDIMATSITGDSSPARLKYIWCYIRFQCRHTARSNWSAGGSAPAFKQRLKLILILRLAWSLATSHETSCRVQPSTIIPFGNAEMDSEPLAFAVSTALSLRLVYFRRTIIQWWTTPRRIRT